MSDLGIYNTASKGEPMEGLSTARLLEIVDSLKRHDPERFSSLTVSRGEPVIHGLPSAAEPKPETLFGFPIHYSDAIPPGYGMGQTSCGCSCGEIERDGGSLMHMAKRHTVIVKFAEE